MTTAEDGLIQELEVIVPSRSLNRDLCGYISTSFLLLQSVALPYTQAELPHPVTVKPRATVHVTINTQPVEVIILNQTPVVPDIKPLQWDNPPLKKPDHRLYTWTDSRNLSLDSSIPLRPYDWPNPVVKAAFRDNLVTASSAVLVGAQPFTQTDWSNPSLQRVNNELKTWIKTARLDDPSLPFNQSDWPNPRRSSAVVIDINTYSVDSVVADPPLPLNQYDWPNPKVLISTANRTWLNPRPYGAEDQHPPIPIDWPNPQPKKDIPAHLKGFVSYLAQEEFIPIFGVTDPNPRIPKVWRDPTIPPNTLLNGIPTNTNPPFAQSDWPNPTGKPYPLANRTYLYSRYLGLADVEPIPLNQAEWPNPRPKKDLSTLQRTHTFNYAFGEFIPVFGSVLPEPQVKKQPDRYTWLQNLLQTTLTPPSGPKPFKVDDWPNPSVKGRDISSYTYLQQKSIFDGAVPLNNYDWPNPRIGRKANIFETNNLLESTLANSELPLPKNTHQWPNPWIPKSRAAWNYFTSDRKFYYTDDYPLSQKDWPNPRAKARSDNKIWSIDNTKNTLLPPIDACTWEGHFNTRGWLSPQEQINAGYPYYIQPGLLTGSYEEIVDYGLLIQNNIATIRWSENPIVGTVVITAKLAVSNDNITYSAFVSDTSVFFNSLRYLKIRLEFTSADDHYFTEISNLQILLDVKREVDSGNGTALSTDISGTEVVFNKAFKDIDSITLTALSTTPVTMVYDFVDIPNPVHFFVYAFNSAGVRVTVPFSWKARGIL